MCACVPYTCTYVHKSVKLMPHIVILFMQVSPMIAYNIMVWIGFSKTMHVFYKCSNVPATYIQHWRLQSLATKTSYIINIKHKAVLTRVPCMHFTPITGSTQWVYNIIIYTLPKDTGHGFHAQACTSDLPIYCT